MLPASEAIAMVESTIRVRGVRNEDVLRAMGAVPRHRFVPREYQDEAYHDHPLPIGRGQTISQPYVVAWMTELLDLRPGDKVLEIGTGSGYQSAVLAELGFVDVFTVEIVPELARAAAARLRDLGYSRVRVAERDGRLGWPDYAPFNGIIATAAPERVPQPLVDQLAEGGRLVIPVGPEMSYQSLWKYVKGKNGELKGQDMGGVAFVPLTGGKPAPGGPA
jgi:protein-L-isoaspartate(D-aspartate) O-methyltransferase